MTQLLLFTLALLHFSLSSTPDPLLQRRLRLANALTELSKELKAATKVFDPAVNQQLESAISKLLILSSRLQSKSAQSLESAAQVQWLDRLERLRGDYHALTSAIRRLDARSLGQVTGSATALARAINQFRRPDSLTPFLASVWADGAEVPAVLDWSQSTRVVLVGDHLENLKRRARIQLKADPPKFATVELKVRERSDSAWEIEMAPDRESAMSLQCGLLLLGERGEGDGEAGYPVCLSTGKPVKTSAELRLRYERRDSVLYSLNEREVRLESKECKSAAARTETLSWPLPYGGRLASVQTRPMETRGVSDLETRIVDDSMGVVSVTARLNPSRCVLEDTTQRPLFSSLWYGYVQPVVVKPSVVSEDRTVPLESSGGSEFEAAQCIPASPRVVLREIKAAVRLQDGRQVATIEGVALDPRRIAGITQQTLGGLEITMSPPLESGTGAQELCVVARQAAASAQAQ